ncbi:MAG: aminodeoxychorismate/anthranilate synthase component II [Fimbriimonadaceae bacterium]|nr:aminodeoxychorismate/anthranilate synthase component II [Fimbriimonadaceae bacterium]QYK56081.1 MAG: aminodeoxychorismate/anthranilate synthase component II [Fimbriimonadaceae bacterium]
MAPFVFVVDNYDSFTYNLVQYLGMCGARFEVRRNDEVDVETIAAAEPDGIFMSPGPCRPTESGVCLDLSRAAATPGSPVFGIPLFGVCLGMQAMGHMGGGRVSRSKTIRHGKTSLIQHDGEGVFTGLPSPFLGVRYHSLSIESGAVPPGYVVTARSLDDDEIMGVRHESLPIEGVQFHPESVLSEHGLQLIDNYVSRLRP